MRFFKIAIISVATIVIINTPHTLHAQENQDDQAPTEPPSSPVFLLSKWGVDVQSREYRLVWTESESTKRERRELEAKQKKERERREAQEKAGRTLQDDVQIIGESGEECVIYARRITGINIHGYAGSVPATSSEPKVGSIALEATVGHASVVVAIAGDNLVVQEANWVRGFITQRVVSKYKMRGYVN